MTKVINRDQLKINFLNNKVKSYHSTQRKAETRTKIQLGGLIFKSGFSDLLGIEQGEDMQLDPGSLEKASIILGALLDAIDQYDQKKDEWKIMGRKHLKYHFLQH